MRLEAGVRPSIVLTDVRLPDGSGIAVFELCRMLLPGVPVIVMTAFGSVSDAVRLVKAGALDYVEKPFDLDALIETARNFASRSARNTSRVSVRYLQSPRGGR